MSRHQQGFTLMEMMVTLTLLALLAAAALPSLEQQAKRQKEQQLQQALRQIRQALDDYQRASLAGRIDMEANASGYPKTLLALSEGVTDKQAADQRKIYFLRRIPRDPMCDCDGKADHESWKTRSSRDAPGQFSRGPDVYDVASSSPETGSNGVLYAQW